MMLLTWCQWCFILKIAFRYRRLGKIGQSDPRIDLLLLSHRAWSDMGDHENDGCCCLTSQGISAVLRLQWAFEGLPLTIFSCLWPQRWSTANDDDTPASRLIQIFVDFPLVVEST